MNDSVRLRKKLLSLIKELGSPGVLASITFKHMDSAQHALMKPSKNITVSFTILPWFSEFGCSKRVDLDCLLSIPLVM
jgi:hypothetical protein